MECRFLLTSRERRFLLAGDFLATAFLVVTLTRVPRSRLPAPLRGSTPYRSPLRSNAAPLRMTRRLIVACVVRFWCVK